MYASMVCVCACVRAFARARCVCRKNKQTSWESYYNLSTRRRRPCHVYTWEALYLAGGFTKGKSVLFVLIRMHSTKECAPCISLLFFMTIFWGKSFLVSNNIFDTIAFQESLTGHRRRKEERRGNCIHLQVRYLFRCCLSTFKNEPKIGHIFLWLLQYNATTPALTHFL